MIDWFASFNQKLLLKYPQLFAHNARQVVRWTAFLIEGDAKESCPVDTGALRASIHTITPLFSGRKTAMLEAYDLYWGNKQWYDPAKFPEAPELKPPNPDDISAYVAAGMGYAWIVENGGARTPAQPFLYPAAERNKPYFVQEMIKAAKATSNKEEWTP